MEQGKVRGTPNPRRFRTIQFSTDWLQAKSTNSKLCERQRKHTGRECRLNLSEIHYSLIEMVSDIKRARPTLDISALAIVPSPCLCRGHPLPVYGTEIQNNIARIFGARDDRLVVALGISMKPGVILLWKADLVEDFFGSIIGPMVRVWSAGGCLETLVLGGSDPSAVAFMWSKSHGFLKLGGFFYLCPASPVDPEASGFATCVEVHGSLEGMYSRLRLRSWLIRRHWRCFGCGLCVWAPRGSIISVALLGYRGWIGCFITWGFLVGAVGLNPALADLAMIL
ncbi:hypothetical protein Nepgr_006745 [Nepenthes gracilis]|uniref:Uncharacterized protein n=1 Tax=Nepenthes gracilis TaxID=150966 RepID=A0AAD3XHQ8_NEPGR|nr:hypothetical protein Nepgr_006745 [Nepenthes gracilis]